MSEMTASQMGRKGGYNRGRNLTARQKSEIGKKGAKARWGKVKKHERKSSDSQEVLEPGE